jgi:hypothetical protein
MTWAETIGYLASALVFLTFCMKTMVPLRVVAIASNVAFISYGFLEGLYPVLVLHLILLPLNIHRTFQMLRLVKQVEEAAKGNLSIEWLEPFMKKLSRRQGEILFRKGDEADGLYCILSGEVTLQEIGETLGRGKLLGEIGLFAPDGRRTLTARCASDVELLWTTRKELAQLCHQNPRMSFHLLTLITRRLTSDIRRLEASMTPT